MNSPRRDFIRNTGILGAKSGNGQELADLLVDKDGKRIKSLTGWKKKRKEIIKTWSGYLGVLPASKNKPVIRVVDEKRSGTLIRQKIEYEGEPGLPAETCRNGQTTSCPCCTSFDK